MDTYYIYVCYPIVDRNDKKNHFIASFEEMTSFITMEEAVDFCKRNYASYLIAVEKCDEEVYNEVKKER